MLSRQRLPAGRAELASMVFVPLLSFTEDGHGSVGELSRMGVDGFDRVDNVLLELILATALREEPRAAVQVYPKPSTLNPQPSTLNPQPSTLNPQPSTLNPQSQPRNPQSGGASGAHRPSADRGAGGGLRSVPFPQAGGAVRRAEQGDQRAGRGDPEAAGAERGQGGGGAGALREAGGGPATLNPKPQTSHSKPQTLNPKPETLNPKP